jgi:hypothetical protein
MSRLLLAVAVAAILFLVGAFVPMGGKTLVERWNGAPSVTQFAERGWNEVVGGWDRMWGVKPAPKPSPRQAAKGSGNRATPSGVTPARKPDPEPVEHHTEADRSAIDRIVAEHAADRPAPRR